MEEIYFVILSHPNGYLPMVDDNDFVAMFRSETEAISKGHENPIGSAYGFEVFEVGGGVFYT